MSGPRRAYELALGLATLLPIPIFLAFVIVLITGSSGFLCHAIAKRLARRYRVVGLDSDEPKQPLH